MSLKTRRRKKRRRRKSKLPAIIVSLVLVTGITLALGLLLFYNPMLEGQLRAQFGDAFFSDFGVASPANGGDNLETIVENYEPAFKELENQALDRLEDLFATAIDDYTVQEQSGTLDRFVLTNKYIQAGRILEKNVDAVFDELVLDFEEELNSLGLPTDIVDEVRQTYDDAKDQKRRELLDRLRRKIGS